MLENAAESHTSGARFVGLLLDFYIDVMVACNHHIKTLQGIYKSATEEALLG
jgi:hypothetical protein